MTTRPGRRPRWHWLALPLVVLAAQQLWRHGHDYVLAEQFAVVDPGKVYRGAWQKPWPMRRIVHDRKIKTIVALAHPADHALAVSERDLSAELGVRWVHIPIVDLRGEGDYGSVSDQLERAVAVVADPANQPVYFHCHHGINRASMLQIAYRTMHCGWSLDRATAEVAKTFGLVAVSHGPDYRHMEAFYRDRVLPRRAADAAAATARVETPGRTL